jgi:hypothetical protein
VTELNAKVIRKGAIFATLVSLKYSVGDVIVNG